MGIWESFRPHGGNFWSQLLSHWESILGCWESILGFGNQFGIQDVDAGHLFWISASRFRSLGVHIKSLGIIFIPLGVDFGARGVDFFASGG